MKHYFLCFALAVSAAFMGCANKEREIASANLNSTANNQSIGSAKFYQLNDGKIKMDLEINMPERADSTVAVHFHEHGDCGNMGENTHGHWNPTNEPHGKWDSDSFHSGDIGNIALDGKGHAKIRETIVAAKALGYDGWLTIEAFGRAVPELAAATRVWRDFFPNPEDVYTEGYRYIREIWDDA